MMKATLPRPLWFFLATVVLILGAAGLRLALPVYREHAARDALVRRGCQLRTEPRAPIWLRELVGEESVGKFDSVAEVFVSDRDFRDEDLALLERLSRLRQLTLHHSAITDAGVPRLARLASLEVLTIRGKKVSDAGLAELRRALPRARIERLSDAFLGVAGTSHPRGAGLAAIMPGSPADRAGLLPGDVVTEMSGESLADFDVLQSQMLKFEPGDEVELKVLRDEALLTLTIVLDEWP